MMLMNSSIFADAYETLKSTNSFKIDVNLLALFFTTHALTLVSVYILNRLVEYVYGTPLALRRF